MAEVLTRKQADLPEARFFCDSMVLSPEAKKFALAREVKRVASGPQYYFTTLNALWVLLTYNIARHGNQKLGLFKKVCSGKRGQEGGLWSPILFHHPQCSLDPPHLQYSKTWQSEAGVVQERDEAIVQTDVVCRPSTNHDTFIFPGERSNLAAN